ncbi:hypothetical protein QTG54_014137 [Skeletonema marinoi]|uniref:Uncharacterized protein n=1 Tax=Skeletonema marinoi TaxID=267567 RepID=A0AAD9D5Q6_9STRA|nr:hypothetical protein QTG54_014137 [Skeletonema marinoi]
MKQLSSPKRSNRGVHGSGPSKQLSASTLQTLETQVTCSTHQSRSRTPSPHQQRQARGMDPGGLIVIPRRKLPDATAAVTKRSAKAAAGDKEVKRNELPTTQQQQQRQETALVVASAVVTPPSILTITDDKESSSDKHEKNNNSVHQVKEVALTLYKDSNKSGTSKSTSSTAVGNKRSSSRPRASGTTSRNDTGIDGNKHHRSNKDDRGRKNKSKLSKSRSSRGNAKESKDAGEDRKNKKSGKTKEQTDKKEDKQPATKKNYPKGRRVSNSIQSAVVGRR